MVGGSCGLQTLALEWRFSRLLTPPLALRPTLAVENVIFNVYDNANFKSIDTAKELGVVRGQITSAIGRQHIPGKWSHHFQNQHL
jgi:hypothetical protein